MQREELEVSLREAGGTGASRRLRARGLVPAVVYGSGSVSVNLAVEDRALNRVLAGGFNQLIDLRGPDAVEGRLVLFKEIQRDPVSQRLVHCDFFQVDTTKKIHVSVPVHFVGKPTGVEAGGVLEILARDVAVECLPLVIPDAFELDVGALEIGDALHASDLQIPPDIELMIDDSVTVVHVIAPRVEAVAEEEEEEAEGVEEGEAPAEGESAAAESSSE